MWTSNGSVSVRIHKPRGHGCGEIIFSRRIHLKLDTYYSKHPKHRTRHGRRRGERRHSPWSRHRPHPVPRQRGARYHCVGDGTLAWLTSCCLHEPRGLGQKPGAFLYTQKCFSLVCIIHIESKRFGSGPHACDRLGVDWCWRLYNGMSRESR
jgi:hypothetical protein